MTVSPRANNTCATCEPMKPAVPVTRTFIFVFIRAFYVHASRAGRAPTAVSYTHLDVYKRQRLSMREAHIAWVRHSPMLDVHDRRRMASQFDQAARLAMMECSFVLEYPRRYESLHEVSTLIRTHMASV